MFVRAKLLLRMGALPPALRRYQHRGRYIMPGTSGHGGYHQCYEDGEEHWDGHRKKAMDMDIGRLMVSGRLLQVL